jgi:cytochrome c oxidase subunit 3
MTQSDQPQPESSTNGGDSPHLAHHFDSLQQQFDSAKLGMWIFLVTEILFFGGLLCAYAVARANRPEAFADGHLFLDTRMGTLNTVLLIFSSLTMALAVRSAQLGNRRSLVGLLTVTLVCAVAFLGVKGVEYKHKWDHQLVPGQARLEYWFSGNGSDSDQASQVPRRRFEPDREYIREHLEHGDGAKLSDEALDLRIENIGSFMGIYFGLTALHAVHVIIGIGVIFWILLAAIGGRYGPRNFTQVDLVGLYWHLVDLIWIYLFPLLYLIG